MNKTRKIKKSEMSEIISSMVKQILAEENEITFDEAEKDELEHLAEEIRLVQGNLDDLMEYSKENEIEEVTTKSEIQELMECWESFKEKLNEIREGHGLVEETKASAPKYRGY